MSAKHGEFRDLITAMFRKRHKHPHLTVILLRQHWADILGRQLADKTYPARISGQTLWINALDASWAYQLQFMKHELLESVQVFMGAVDITDLRFKEGELHSASKEERTQDKKDSTVYEGMEVRDSAEGGAAEGMEVRDSAEGGAAEGTDPGGMDSNGREEEAAITSSAAIADDSLRDSFRRWARVKKRNTRSGA